MTDFNTNCASFGRFCTVQNSKFFYFTKKQQKIFEDISKNQKLSHKNAIKGHIFGDADFADF